MTSRLRKWGTGALTALGLAAVGFVGAQEGLRLKSYPDVIGVWTACYGETKDIRPGMTFTKAECDQKFANRLVEFETALQKCLPNWRSIPDRPYITFISLEYNIGKRAFCHSTLVRRANAGDIKGACNALPMWNRAGGRVVKGLVSRRERERQYCLSGLK